jgi:hypothetical protein
MVLVYEDDLDFLKEQRRKTFLRNLMADGLEIEMENPDPTKRVSLQINHFSSLSFKGGVMRMPIIPGIRFH